MRGPALTQLIVLQNQGRPSPYAVPEEDPAICTRRRTE